MTGPASLASSELLAAYGLDLLVGDPPWLPHPIRFMGRVIAWAERTIRRIASGPWQVRAAGIALAIALPALAYAAGWVLLKAAAAVHPWLATILAVYLASTTLAVRSLHDEAANVARALEGSDLAAARARVSRIVGRETAEMEPREVVRAAVESVAESTCDGIVAPLFYLWLGGVPLALAYKAVSTLDSMIGYTSPSYRAIGWASARLDDAMNYLPARVTGLLIAAVAGVAGRGVEAWRVMRRDGGKHESPNSGVSEAAMAGALGVQLGGPTRYRDGLRSRVLLGEPRQPLDSVQIRRAIRMSRWVAALMVVLVLAAQGCTVGPS